MPGCVPYGVGALRMHASSPSQTQGPGSYRCVELVGGPQELGVRTEGGQSSHQYGGGYGSLYLEEVLKIVCCELLHLRCIARKPADGALPKWRYEAEPEQYEHGFKWLAPYPGGPMSIVHTSCQAR